MSSPKQCFKFPWHKSSSRLRHQDVWSAYQLPGEARTVSLTKGEQAPFGVSVCSKECKTMRKTKGLLVGSALLCLSAREGQQVLPGKFFPR